MKNQLSFIGLFVLIVILFSSCNSSKDFADNGILTKRKYRKGYHINGLMPRVFQQNEKKGQATARLFERETKRISSLEVPSEVAVSRRNPPVLQTRDLDLGQSALPSGETSQLSRKAKATLDNSDLRKVKASTRLKGQDSDFEIELTTGMIFAIVSITLAASSIFMVLIFWPFAVLAGLAGLLFAYLAISAGEVKWGKIALYIHLGLFAFGALLVLVSLVLAILFLLYIWLLITQGL